MQGRPSAYDEFKNAHWHARKWEEPTDLVALEKRIKSKVYSLKDMWLYQGLTGNIVVLKQAADKMLPDRAPVDEDGNTVANQVLAMLSHEPDDGGS